jgi:hypothetical protein
MVAATQARSLSILGICCVLAACNTDFPQPAPVEHNAPAVAVACVEGRPHGAFAWRAPNGVVQVRGQFVDGKKEGVWDFWHSSGTQLVRVRYTGGIRNGRVTMWYAEPCCFAGDEPFNKLEGTYVNGVYDGTKSSYYPSRSIERLRSVTYFTRGEIVSAEHWDPDHRKVSPAEALAAAERDVESDEAYFQRLDAIVRDAIPCSYEPQP